MARFGAGGFFRDFWLYRTQLWRRPDGAGDQRSQHDFKISKEGVGRLHLWVHGLAPVDRHLDASPELAGRNSEDEPLLAADPFDGRDALRRIEAGIVLIEVARAHQMLRDQLLEMGRDIQRSNQ